VAGCQEKQMPINAGRCWHDR